MGRVGDRLRRSPKTPTKPPKEPTPETHPWLYVLGLSGQPPIIRYLSGSYYPSSPAALKKSWLLLNEHLDKKQRASLVKHGRFVIESVGRGKKVTIHANFSQVNIIETASDGSTTKLCTVTREPVPLWDHILGQTLAVKYNWTSFRRTAVKMTW